MSVVEEVAMRMDYMLKAVCDGLYKHPNQLKWLTIQYFKLSMGLLVQQKAF